MVVMKTHFEPHSNYKEVNTICNAACRQDQFLHSGLFVVWPVGQLPQLAFMMCSTKNWKLNISHLFQESSFLIKSCQIGAMKSTTPHLSSSSLGIIASLTKADLRGFAWMEFGWKIGRRLQQTKSLWASRHVFWTNVETIWAWALNLAKIPLFVLEIRG